MMIFEWILVAAVSLFSGIFFPIWDFKVHSFFKNTDEIQTSPRIFKIIELVRENPTGLAKQSKKKSNLTWITTFTIMMVAFSPFGFGIIKDIILDQNPIYHHKSPLGLFDFSPAFEFAEHIKPNIKKPLGLLLAFAYLGVYFDFRKRNGLDFDKTIDYEKADFKKEFKHRGLGYLVYGLSIFVTGSFFSTLFFGIPLDPRFPGLCLLHVMVALIPGTLTVMVFDILKFFKILK